MTDLEITRLCAEAMDLCEDEQTTRTISYREEGHIWIRHEADAIGKMYHPLHDDAQAMALVKKFHIQLDKTLRTPDDPYGQWIASKTDKWVSEPTDDLNRAICECVAKMQAAKVAP